MALWLRRRPSLPATALAMIGPRGADEILFLGAGNTALAAETGAVTRLNGRTVVAGQGADAARQTQQAAQKAGAILEFVDAPLAQLPFDAGTFHIVVAPAMAEWLNAEWLSKNGAWLTEAVRVLRPGGRIILTIGEAPRGLLWRSNVQQPGPATDVVLALLTNGGFIAARRLAEADGVAYYEARKARDSV